MRKTALSLAFLFGAAALATTSAFAQTKKVAIANFGPHGSLEQVIAGFKEALADKVLSRQECHLRLQPLQFRPVAGAAGSEQARSRQARR